MCNRECIITTNVTPHYIFSFPEVINTPPNMPLQIPISLEGFQSPSIFEMNVTVHYNPDVFTPSTIEGVNSFSNENYNMEIIYGYNFIDLKCQCIIYEIYIFILLYIYIYRYIAGYIL